MINKHGTIIKDGPNQRFEFATWDDVYTLVDSTLNPEWRYTFKIHPSVVIWTHLDYAIVTDVFVDDA